MEERLDMQSPNWVRKNSAFIAQYFPNCVTETAEGIKIDFEILQQELCSDLIQGNKERYRLEWPGKRESIVTANLPTTKTLRPVREDSVDFDNTENLYIEGDNLEVLKLLQESYLGKIKMIYIDPPYNTGKDFVYKDNFSKNIEDELIESGQKNEYNQRLVANPETAGRYHSDWLSMIYPRLKLARNLLTQDGVIFISIDDNEVHNLKRVCDEIFGMANFIANVVWEKKYTVANDAKYFSDNHDHILVYTKDVSVFEIGRLPRTDKMNAAYKNPDNHPKGIWKATPLQAKSGSGGEEFVHTFPNGVSWSPPKGRFSAYSHSKLDELYEGNEIWFGKDGNSTPSRKTFLTELKNSGVVPRTILSYSEAGHNHESIQEIKDLFEANLFTNPKPTKLLLLLSKIANLKNDSIVLDFFSGSASTAHAIMLYNKNEQTNVKSIQVQLPEQIDDKDEAYKEGYKLISELGRERIRRAAKKIKEETNADIDYGFRVYRLDSSNMQDVYYKPQDYDQGNLDLFGDNVKPDRTADDLLAQVMLDWGLPLSLKIEQVDVLGKNVFKVAENSLYACFDMDIDEDFAKAIAKEKPLRIVFKDSGFKNDTAKTNVKQLLKQLSPETEMKVI